MATPEQRTEFLEAALWHGPLDRANAILATDPDLAASDIHTAAVLGMMSLFVDSLPAIRQV